MTAKPQQPNSDSVTAFVQHLHALRDNEDRGALAALRASLQDANGMAAAACPHVMPFLPGAVAGYWDRAFFLVGALFALHPAPGGEGKTLGHVFRAINDAQEGPGKPDNESLRRRFVALLDADAEDLPHHLRQAVSLARAKEVSIDWARLLRDVLGWRSEPRYVQRRLARDFWNVPLAALESEGDTP